MTITNNYAVLKYEGNGATTNFSFPWPVYQSDNIVVLQNILGVESVVPPTNYSVNLTESGGVISFNTAPAAGTTIAISRSTPLSQETPYKTSSGFDAVAVEHNFDKQTMSLQEIRKELDLCIKKDVFSEGDPNKIFLDFLDDVAEIIQTAQTAKESAVAAASSASASAAAALSYAENVKFGMRREAITVNDWMVSSGRYAIFFADVGIVAGVYMADGANFKLIQNIDVIISDSGTTITSLAPFAGYVLLVESVNNQYTYTQNNASDHWVIEHNMGKYPTVQCLNTNNVVMAGTITHDNLNKLHIDFVEPVSGKAILN